MEVTDVKRKMLMALAALALAVLLLARRLKLGSVSPIPLYPDFAPDDFSPELFEVETSDGLVLRGKRYPNPGATPVILVAGFSGNGFNYDIAFERSNFALCLARAGYDVWIGNFRGTGREPYKSEGGGFTHYIQDLCAYDLPALVDAVAERTGRRPFVFGHSLGGVVCYGYLQGATFDGASEDRLLTSDPELAAERNLAVEGIVSIAGPASFYFPKGNRYYWLIGNPVSRTLIRAFAALVIRISARRGQVPVEQTVTSLFERSPALGYLVSRIGFHFFGNMERMTREMLVESALSGTSDVSFREQFQLLKAILTRDLITSSIMADGSVGHGHNLTRNMHMITAPVLFVAGELDAVRPDILYRDGYLQVSSEVKDYMFLDGYGHVDLIQGLDIREEVLPGILEWLGKVRGEQ
jgi:pimeloyl-ACP methyl ester carboxylesterase